MNNACHSLQHYYESSFVCVCVWGGGGGEGNEAYVLMESHIDMQFNFKK